MSKHPFAIMLRAGKVLLACAELEDTVDFDVDRFEAEQNGSGHCAHIDLSEIDTPDEPWTMVRTFLAASGPRLLELIRSERVGDATIDVAYNFDRQYALISRQIPSDVVKLAGEAGIAIDVTIYIGSDD